MHVSCIIFVAPLGSRHMSLSPWTKSLTIRSNHALGACPTMVRTSHALKRFEKIYILCSWAPTLALFISMSWSKPVLQLSFRLFWLVLTLLIFLNGDKSKCFYKNDISHTDPIFGNLFPKFLVSRSTMFLLFITLVKT